MRRVAAAAQVDIVYVAMVHTGHREAALQMVAAGKHVLIEKPMAMNHTEAAEMVEAAKKQVGPPSTCQPPSRGDNLTLRWCTLCLIPGRS